MLAEGDKNRNLRDGFQVSFIVSIKVAFLFTRFRGWKRECLYSELGTPGPCTELTLSYFALYYILLLQITMFDKLMDGGDCLTF